MVRIADEKGIPFIEIDGTRHTPAAFRSFRPRPDNIQLAYRAGVRLFQILVSGLNCTLNVPYSLFGGVWQGEGKYDFSAFDRQFDMFRENAPEGYFNVMLQLDACPWFAASHPGEDTDSYRHISEAALNEDWKRAAADYLKAFIAYAEEKYGDRIWAYSIAAGSSNEWFDASLFDRDFDRENTRLTALWRRVIGKPDAPVPTLESLEDGCGLRRPDSDDFRYLRLAGEQISRLICFFAHEAQKTLCHRKLFGLFFGYAYTEGHLICWNTNDYERVWKSDDIDMLYAPASYRHHRDIDGVSTYQYTVDSIRLHKKLYLHENDHRTPLARFPLENGAMLQDAYTRFSDWREVFRRELCNTMQKQAAFWWFDFFGGYYGAPEYEAELALEKKVFDALAKGTRESVSEIAVFTDPTSLLCTREHTLLCHDSGIRCIDTLHRCGAPFDIFNLNDLPLTDPARYKLYIFLNAYLLSDAQIEWIRENLTGKTKVFVHAAGAWDGKSFNPERVSSLCGMRVTERTGTDSTSEYRGTPYRFSGSPLPLYQVEEAGAEVLARYADGAVSCARKGENVYSAVAPLPWQLWRDIADAAGVHIWENNGAATAVCSQFVCCYAPREEVTLRMKRDGAYRELFSGETFVCENGELRYRAEKYRTMLFVRE